MLKNTISKALLTTGLILWPALAFGQVPYELTAEDKAVLQNQDVLTHVWRDKARGDGALDVFGAIDVDASPQEIWNLMTDCTRGMELVKGMLSCTVLETEPGGAADIREQVFTLGFLMPNAKTRFRSVYEPYKNITIRRTGGDMRIQDAVWSLTPQANGLTRVSYRGTILLKFPVPGPLIKRATRKDTPKIMQNIKRVAEAESQKKRALANVSASATANLK